MGKINKNSMWSFNRPCDMKILANQCQSGISTIVQVCIHYYGLFLYSICCQWYSIACKTGAGMHRLWQSFSNYCSKELVINYSKSKVLFFTEKFKWSVTGHNIDQVKQFRHLGVMFQANLSWKIYLNSAMRTATSSARATILWYIMHLQFRLNGLLIM